MSQSLRVLAIGSLLALAGFLACDSSQTTTSPTATASSNRFSGSFVSATAGAARLAASPSSTFDGMVVSDKRNPSVRADISSNGTFVLDHVAGGNVTLVFTRDGRSIGEVTVRSVGSGETIRLLLELTASDTVVLIEVRRASADDSSDDNSRDDQLELELDPDEWCSKSSDDDSSSGSGASGSSSDDDSDDGDLVFATIRGGLIGDVDLNSIRMVGPSGEASPSSVELKGDRIEVIFDKSDALAVVSGVADGQRVTIQIRGRFLDGSPWELTERVRIECDDDDSSDDNSSG